MSSSIIQVLVQLLQCNRRVPSPTATTQKISHVKFQDEPTKACNDGGPGDLSSTDISDECSQAPTDSSNEAMDVPNSPKSGAMPPPGLKPPPGLEQRLREIEESHESRRNKYWSRITSQQSQQMPRRAETCPSQRAEIERGGRRPTARDQSSLHARRPKQPTPPANDPFVALKEALDKLAPTEIATVRSLRDSKIAGAGSNSLNAPPWTKSRRQDGSQRQFLLPKPAKNQSVASEPNNVMEDTGDSLQSFLRDLAFIDDTRVLSVRKINALGFDSSPLLQTYFSKFGTVDRVMVAPTVVKCGTQKYRARPPGLGFVVMSTSEEVQAVLNCGETHTVGSAEIRACPFQSHSADGN